MSMPTTPGGMGFEELEELDFGANQHVIAGLLRSVETQAEKLAKRIRENFDAIRGCRPLAENILSECKPPCTTGISGFADSFEPEAGVAVDSTFPPEGGVDMVVGSLVGVVAGYIAYRLPPGLGIEKRRVDAVTFIVEKQEDANRRASLISKLMERKLLLRLIERLPEGSAVLIDGEIVPYTLLFTKTSTRLKRRLDEVTVSLLRRAEEKRIALIGVVKRSYTSLLNAYVVKAGCGKRLSLNDKAVFSIVLRPGRVARLGRFGDILPDYALTLSVSNPSKLAGLVKRRLEERGEYGEILVGYYKPSSVPQAWQAVKIEVYAPWLRDPLAAAAYHLDTLTSPATGLPYPIDLVDELVRIEARALEVVRYRLVRLLREKLQEHGIHDVHALTLTLHTNPEKRYLYQPRGR